MAKKRKPPPKSEDAFSAEKDLLPLWQQAILRHVKPMKDVAGVFVLGDPPGICEVYWVVEEVFTPATDRVLRKEHLLREEFPDIRFYFHVWAHQGRDPNRAVPRGLKPLLVRHER